MPQNETVTVKTNSGDIDFIIPSGMSDEQAKVFIRTKKPELFESSPSNYRPGGIRGLPLASTQSKESARNVVLSGPENAPTTISDPQSGFSRTVPRQQARDAAINAIPIVAGAPAAGVGLLAGAGIMGGAEAVKRGLKGASPTEAGVSGGLTAGGYLAIGMVPKIIMLGQRLIANGGTKELAADLLEKYISKRIAKRIAPEFYSDAAKIAAQEAKDAAKITKASEDEILSTVINNEKALQAAESQSQKLENAIKLGKEKFGMTPRGATSTRGVSGTGTLPPPTGGSMSSTGKQVALNPVESALAKGRKPPVSTVSPEYQPPMGKVTLQSVSRETLLTRIKDPRTPYADRRLYLEELGRNPGNVPQDEISRLSRYVIGDRGVVPWRNLSK